MDKLCKFCGGEIKNGNCVNGPHTFPKMCLNCKFSADCGTGIVCDNEENKMAQIEKIKKAAMETASGYELTNINIEVKPLPLKRPKLFCGKWQLSDEMVENIKAMFVATTEKDANNA